MAHNIINGTAGDDNPLNGTADHDSIFGFEGNDLINGLAGADIMWGGLGDDFYFADNTGDQANELAGEGTDSVSSSVNYTLSANVENLTITGAATKATGNAQNNILTGNGLNNTLDGKAGADTMIGGLGNDTYIVDNALDIVTELLNEGTDTVKSSVSFILGANIEKLTLTGVNAIDGTGNDLANTLIGNAAANVLSGGVGNDTLDGKAGADTMLGGLGNDTYVVDNVLDIVTELSGVGSGSDTVKASVSYTLGDNLEKLTLTGLAAIDGTGNTLANTLTGNDAANLLDGGGGKDILSGKGGADTLIGGAAADTLTGGAGNDTFKYLALGDGGDTIKDFSQSGVNGADLIDVAALDANSALGGDQSFIWGGIAATSNGAWYAESGGTKTILSFDTDGNTATVEMSLTLTGVTLGLGLADFVGVVSANQAPTISGLSLSETAISFTADDPDNATLSLVAPFAVAFGNPVITSGAVTNLTPTAQASAVSGTLQVTDGALTADVVGLYLGTTGNDSLTAAAIGAALYGLDGNDTLTGGTAADWIFGGAGYDILTGGAGADTLTGGLGGDTFIISSVADFIGDTINGTWEAGNADVLRLEDADAWTFSGVTNIDLLGMFDNAPGFNLTVGDAMVSTASWVWDGNLGIYSDVAMSFGVTINASGLTGVNRIDVTGFNLDGADSITGGAGDDSLRGGAGADTLTGGAGNDYLIGGAGADTLTGGLGGDIFAIEAFADFAAGETIDGTAEAATQDLLQLYDAGTYNLTGVSNIDWLGLNENAPGWTVTVGDTMVASADADGNGVGGDLRIYAPSAMTNGVTINASALTGVNRITVDGATLGGNDAIDGGAGADLLTGGAGNDTLSGRAGVDTLIGGLGADTFFINAVTDFAAGETIDGTWEAGTSDTLNLFGAGAYNFSGVTNIDDICMQSSTSGWNLTLGDALVSTADFNGDGVGGDLRIFVNSFPPSGVIIDASGLTGVNRIIVQGSNLNGATISGGAGDDDITGGRGGDDTLSGNGGNDLLHGYEGADNFTGGAGSDSFFFSTGHSGQTAGTIDVITDYAKGAVGVGDEIDFGGTLVIGGSNAAATATEASINATTGVATFDAGSGATLADALADIAARFTAATNSTGEFALFQVNNTGDFHLFISDGTAGVTASDVVVQLAGITSIGSIDLTGGDLTILS